MILWGLHKGERLTVIPNCRLLPRGHWTRRTRIPRTFRPAFSQFDPDAGGRRHLGYILAARERRTETRQL